MSRERSCLILKPVINENEIEFCRKALLPQMINFSQLLENLLRWIFTLNTLRWALVARAGNDMCPGYCRPAFLTTSSQKQFQKFNIQEKREKKFNLISRPLRKVVQEKMARPGWSPSNYSKSHLLQPFSAQGWLDASNCG